MTKPSKFGGRPGREPTEGERVHLGFRVTPELKALVEKAAESSGRSQSQEAELRLERSFERQGLRGEVLAIEFGPELAGLLLMIGATLRDLGPQVGLMSTMTLEGAQRWLDDPFAFDQAVAATSKLLEALRPEGDASPPPAAAAIGADFGAGFANSTIGAVATAGEGGITQRLKADGAEIAKMLGPSLVARLKEVDDGSR